jgi:hypothetical protein
VLRRRGTGRPVAAEVLGRDLARALIRDGAGELLSAPARGR